MPQGDTEYTFQNVAPDFLADFESSGPGWIWDFTELAVVDSTVTLVEDISEASFTAQFVFNGFDPEYQADHFYTFLNIPDFGDFGGDVGIPVQLDEVVGYHQIAGGTYNQVGLGMSLSGLELPIPFEDVDEVHPVPLTVDATLESTAAYEVVVPATLTYVVDQTRFSEVDGYGTLLLPDGTSHEVLRLKSTVSSEDSVYVDLAEQGFAFERETVTYLWLGDGGMPWMEVTTTLGIPSVVRYQGTVLAEEDTSSTDGLAALQSEMRLMPNPAPWRCGHLGPRRPAGELDPLEHAGGLRPARTERQLEHRRTRRRGVPRARRTPRRLAPFGGSVREFVPKRGVHVHAQHPGQHGQEHDGCAASDQGVHRSGTRASHGPTQPKQRAAQVG